MPKLKNPFGKSITCSIACSYIILTALGSSLETVVAMNWSWFLPTVAKKIYNIRGMAS
jgi:hypothetical protein